MYSENRLSEQRGTRVCLRALASATTSTSAVCALRAWNCCLSLLLPAIASHNMAARPLFCLALNHTFRAATAFSISP